VDRVDSALSEVLRPLVVDLRAGLGDELAAIWLTGSAAAGAFTPEVSDLDLIVVTGTPVSALDLAALDQIHRRVAERDPSWTDRLEVVYVASSTLTERRGGDGLAVVSPGEPFHLTGPASDWLQNWFFAREGGIAVYGREPRELIPPIGEAAFRAAILHYLDYLRGADPSGYVVLSACRCLLTLETGDRRSKEEAAGWARTRFPEWAWLIDAAWMDRRAPKDRAFAASDMRAAARRFVELVASQAGLEGAPPA
jgi:predicted nucleotidyltransferase